VIIQKVDVLRHQIDLAVVLPEGYEELDSDQGGHRAEDPDDSEGPDNTEDNEDNLQNGED
jgi:ribonuclease R